MRRLIAVPVVLLALSFGVLAAPSNKWRIQVSSDADSDGAVVFLVAPAGGTPVDVTVQIQENSSENHVARLIRDAMRVQLGEGYDIEVDDGEDVLLKKRHSTPDFDLVIKQKSVEGVRITLDRE